LHTPAQQATLDALGNATSVSNSSFDASGTTAQWRCPDGRLLEDPTVIVGTDGSGTRVVAKLLSLLNVTVCGSHLLKPVRFASRSTRFLFYSYFPDECLFVAHMRSVAH